MNRLLSLTLLTVGLAPASAPAQTCLSDFASFAACTGNTPPTSIEDFEGFAVDTPYAAPTVLTLAVGTMTIVNPNPSGGPNIVDVLPYATTVMNGSNLALATIGGPTGAEVRIALASPAASFGCRFARAGGEAGVEMALYDGGVLIEACPVPTNLVDQFAGYVCAAGTTVDEVRFRALSPGSESFGFDELMTGVGAGCGALPLEPCYVERQVFLARCTPTAAEDFEGFSADATFRQPSTVTTAVGTITTVNPTPSSTYNRVDVPPFQHSAHNGTNHAFCQVGDSPVPAELHIDFGQPVNGFGADVSCATSGAVAELVLISNGSEVAVCAVASNDIDQFIGYFDPVQTIDKAVFRAVVVDPDTFAEVFSVDNLVACVADPIGTIHTLCDPSVPNSTGAGAVIGAQGSTSIAAMDVRLGVDCVPPGQFGIFFVSQTIGFVANPGGSQGNVCVLGNQGRYRMPGQVFSGAGCGASVPAGGLQVGGVPVPVNPPLATFTPGTWYFQSWFRDVGGTSNFSNVLQVDFVP